MDPVQNFGAIPIVIALVLSVLWMLLPFAVFGTKPMIQKAIAEAQQANEHLKALVDQQRVLIEQQKLLTSAFRASRTNS